MILKRTNGNRGNHTKKSFNIIWNFAAVHVGGTRELDGFISNSENSHFQNPIPLFPLCKKVCKHKFIIINIFNWIIVGLGNPGQEYDDTRHNIGFEAINFIAKKNNVIFKPNHNSLTAKLKIKNDTILLCKPLNVMNRSGSPTKYFLDKYQIDTEKLIVISDDINLPLGKIRIRKGGSAGGHNGLKSIIKHSLANYNIYLQWHFDNSNDLPLE